MSILEGEGISCDPQTLANATWKGERYFGERVTFTCERNLVMMNETADHLDCGEDGKWTGSLSQCLTEKELCCEDIQISNAYKDGGALRGQFTKFTCIDGFVLTEGDTVLTCSANGERNGVIPDCDGKC
ncbi:hypothetical protein CAPTEDRAFT_209505 [Capitella teleta]|uniref:Sushi domain-containing protein n=1 Tax=Capitella teleta TaxID=283909 RepID=R7TMJ8_CAPTE|nr:hypothetical protein CAPTEDRAFT_209505 [Capitella teleta]|eukprot:ELT92295.1 hypothetical protein CAPTEDRAFT_209505 [Capitella teleta]